MAGGSLPPLGGRMNGDPQIEEGYTKIANELLEALSRAMASGLISGQEGAVINWIMRYTYGFQQKNGYFKTSFIAKNLGLSKSRVSQILRHLEGKNIITRENGEIELNKHYLEWKSLTVDKQSLTVDKQSLTVDKQSLTRVKQAQPERDQLEPHLEGKKIDHKIKLYKENNINKTIAYASNSSLTEKKKKEKINKEAMLDLIRAFCEEMGFEYGSASIRLNVKPAKWLLEHYDGKQIMDAIRWQKKRILKEKKNPALLIPNLISVQKWIDNWLGLMKNDQEDEVMRKNRERGFIV